MDLKKSKMKFFKGRKVREDHLTALINCTGSVGPHFRHEESEESEESSDFSDLWVQVLFFKFLEFRSSSGSSSKSLEVTDYRVPISNYNL